MVRATERIMGGAERFDVGCANVRRHHPWGDEDGDARSRRRLSRSSSSRVPRPRSQQLSQGATQAQRSARASEWPCAKRSTDKRSARQARRTDPGETRGREPSGTHRGGNARDLQERHQTWIETRAPQGTARTRDAHGMAAAARNAGSRHKARQRARSAPGGRCRSMRDEPAERSGKRERRDDASRARTEVKRRRLGARGGTQHRRRGDRAVARRVAQRTSV